MNKCFVFLTIALTHLNVLAQKNFPENFQKGGLPIGEKLPSIVLTSLEGEKIDVSTLTDKVVYLNYWFVGCTGCKQEEYFLKEISEHFSDSEDVMFVSITPSSFEDVRDYFTKHVDFGFTTLVHEGFRSVKKDFKVRTFPHHQIIVNGVIDENILCPIGSEGLKNWMIKAIQRRIDNLKN